MIQSEGYSTPTCGSVEGRGKKIDILISYLQFSCKWGLCYVYLPFISLPMLVIPIRQIKAFILTLICLLSFIIDVLCICDIRCLSTVFTNTKLSLLKIQFVYENALCL